MSELARQKWGKNQAYFFGQDDLIFRIRCNTVDMQSIGN
jgi:hypothetical protein